MRKIILLASLLLCCCIANAQKGKKTTIDKKKFTTIDYSLFDCLYEYQIHTINKSGNPIVETYNTILQVGSDVAKFWDYTAFASDSVSYLVPNSSNELKNEFVNRVRRQVYYFDATTFQGYPAGKLTTNDVITPNNYIYSQDLNLFNWQLSQDTLSVCGYLCHKATASYGGRDWVAWYAQDVPSGAGPWKLSGLPGLILQADDAEGVHSFRAISIRKKALPIYMEKNAQRIKVAREKFLPNKIEYEKDPFNNIPVEAIGSMTVVRFGEGANDKTALVNGVQIRIRPNGYTPLELK